MMLVGMSSETGTLCTFSIICTHTSMYGMTSGYVCKKERESYNCPKTRVRNKDFTLCSHG